LYIFVSFCVSCCHGRFILHHCYTWEIPKVKPALPLEFCPLYFVVAFAPNPKNIGIWWSSDDEDGEWLLWPRTPAVRWSSWRGSDILVTSRELWWYPHIY
jgi:hypothetical protein